MFWRCTSLTWVAPQTLQLRFIRFNSISFSMGWCPPSWVNETNSVCEKRIIIFYERTRKAGLAINKKQKTLLELFEIGEISRLRSKCKKKSPETTSNQRFKSDNLWCNVLYNLIFDWKMHIIFKITMFMVWDVVQWGVDATNGLERNRSLSRNVSDLCKSSN